MVLGDVVGFFQDHIASVPGNQSIFTSKYTFNSLLFYLLTIGGPFPIMYGGEHINICYRQYQNNIILRPCSPKL